MNRIFRFSGLAVLTAAIVGFGSTAAMAQDPCADSDAQTALYTKFTELYPKTDLPSRKEALNTAKSFLEKYGSCEPLKEQNDYFKTAVPAMEKAIADIEKAEELKKLFARFDNAVKADNADEIYAAGQEILAKQPDNMNIIIPMGVVGAYQSNAGNNFKYADNGIRYANAAMAKINSGATFPKAGGKAGVFQYEFTKAEATNELKYAIAFLTYYGKKDHTAALPLYYELSQGAYKDDPRIYATIGDYYVEKRKPLAEQIRLKIQEQSAATTPEERKVALEDEIKKLVALFNGYNERILDAYGRAYKVTKDTPANKAYRDNLFKIMEAVYESRFEKKTGLNEYITATVSKPFPNPTSEVTPVADPEADKSTSSGSTTTTTAQPAAANGKTAAATKPKK